MAPSSFWTLLVVATLATCLCEHNCDPDDGEATCDQGRSAKKGPAMLQKLGIHVKESWGEPEESCKSWCEADDCSKKNCQGCGICLPATPAPPDCQDWCLSRDGFDEDQCTWASCKGCYYCTTESPTPVPTLADCESWCDVKSNTDQCTWEVCRGCKSCPKTPSPTTPYPTPPPTPAVTQAEGYEGYVRTGVKYEWVSKYDEKGQTCEDEGLLETNTQLTLDECETKCTENPDCKYFVWKSFGNYQCETFTKCDDPSSKSDYWLYKQHPPCSTLAAASYEPFVEVPHPTFSCKASCETDERASIFKCTDLTGDCAACSECANLVTKKRGFADIGVGREADEKNSEHQDCEDSAALGLSDSWFYTWHPTSAKDSQCYNAGTPVGKEFVPMILNCDTADKVWEDIEEYAEEWKKEGVKFLLGYNEPDGHVQTCDPDTAVEKWITVQKIAKYFDPPLTLVSPAPLSGADDGEGGFRNGKSPWLDEFFEKCEKHAECVPDDIKYIGFHDYEADFEYREDNLQNRIKYIAGNYTFSNGEPRQIWVTEWAMACGATSLCKDCDYTDKFLRNKCTWPSDADDSLQPDDQLEFMQKVIPFFERSEHVFRYAYFGTRFKPSQLLGYLHLIAWDRPDKELTCQGEYYKDAPNGFAR